MVTIKDIAERAGVSFSTVSKALRDSPLVKKNTKEHILSIAKELGYQPNFAARSLVSRKSRAIGVVWPSIERSALSTLITRLNEALENEGYTTLLSISRLDSAIETFRRFQVDAILVFGDKDNSVDHAGLNQSQIPILTYGTTDYTPYSTVDVNRGQAIRLAVRHLAELGHRHIAYIGEPQTRDPLQTVKIHAFKDEAARLGIKLSPESVRQTVGLELHDGYLAARSLLNKPELPTAVISGSIDLTSGVLKAASERGLQIPQQLSVVSYDNLPQMEDLEVPMTAVGVAISTMTSAITSAILDLVEAPQSLKKIHLEPELIIRSSTAGPRSDSFLL